MLEFLYSGHESFSLRISWLPKAVAALEVGEDPFSDHRIGMTSLGLGKNMIQSLSFWVVATGLAHRKAGRLQLTEFGKTVLGRSGGFDPFLENSQTLWLLHWNLCQGWEESGKRRRPYAWYFFANVLTNDEITASEAVDHFAGGPVSWSRKDLSSVKLRQHFQIFVRTYVQDQPSGSRSTPEDMLDSPLTTIGLLRENGDRKLPSGKRESVYRFSTGGKPSLSSRTFRYCLHDWWERNRPNEQSLMVRQISHEEDSPGRCFRLPESAIHRIMVDLAKEFPREFELMESRSQRGIRRLVRPESGKLLRSVFNP